MMRLYSTTPQSSKENSLRNSTRNTIFFYRKHPQRTPNPPWEYAICIVRVLSHYNPSNWCNSCFPAYPVESKMLSGRDSLSSLSLRRRYSRLLFVVVMFTICVVRTRKSHKRRFRRVQERERE